MSDRPTLSREPSDDAAIASAAAEKLGDERRWALRRASVMAGKIISDQLPGVVGCVVRDVSATGALIELRPSKDCAVTSPAGLPDAFALIMVRDHSEVRCKVAWRRASTIGVKFMGAFRLLPPPLKPAAKAPVKRR